MVWAKNTGEPVGVPGASLVGGNLPFFFFFVCVKPPTTFLSHHVPTRPIHTTLDLTQTVNMGAYPDVAIIRENSAAVFVKARSSKQSGDICTFHFDSYSSQELRLSMTCKSVLALDRDPYPDPRSPRWAARRRTS